MAWKILLQKTAEKQLKKLPKEIQKKIVSHLYNEVIFSPREYGKSLVGDKYGRAWRYRVGDYRIICNINDKEIIIEIIKIGHRKDIYK